MDIAAAYQVKPPVRQDAQRAPAPANDPYQDDFGAELNQAAAEPAAPPKPKAKASVEDAEQPKESKTVQTPEPGATPDGAQIAVAANTAAKAQPEISGETSVAQGPGSNPLLGQKQTPQPFAPAPNGTAQPAGPQQDASIAFATAASAQAAEATNANTANETPAPTLIPALQTQALAPAQPNGPQAKPVKGQSAESQSAAATQATAPAPQTAPQAQPAAVPVAQNAADQDGQGRPDGQAPAAASAQPAGQQPSVETPISFKPDASAAAIAPQPASPSVQNAPAMTPVLVAQNAPVIVPPDALGVAIARKALEGVNKFEIRLDPPELGRVEVLLEVDDSGTTRAHIRAERPEALELLQREAKGMEQALRQAGLQFDQSSLSFSLTGRDGRDLQEHAQQGRRAKFNAVLPEDEIQAAALRGSVPAAAGLDLRV